MPNRLKIDLDRDEKWDEKWTVKDGAIQRDIAPADDERYTQTLWWSGSSWRERREEAMEEGPGPGGPAPAGGGAGGGTSGGVAAPAEVEPVPVEPVPARVVPADVPGEDAVTAALRAMAGRRLSSEKEKDVTKGQAYKVNLYQDAGESQVNRAKVDLDRDDKWDGEVDSVRAGAHRAASLAPADDGRHPEADLRGRATRRSSGRATAPQARGSMRHEPTPDRLPPLHRPARLPGRGLRHGMPGPGRWSA
ncbi:MAG: hypothetical protein R3F60_16640 [bacterium]